MKTTKLLAATAVLAAVGGAGATAAAAAAPGAATAPARQSVTTQYEGTVVSVNRAARTFRLRDSERGTISIRVTSRTSFERLSGLSSLRAGMRAIEADVRRSNGRWVASHVERSGGGGEHGGDDRRRGGGDDSGGRGRGRDHAEDD